MSLAHVNGHCPLQDKDKDRDKVLKRPHICYVFEKLRVQGYKIWQSCIISASSAHHQCIISISSMHHQHIISALSAHHQCIISASSAHHQHIISKSSAHHQRIIRISSAHHQRIISASSAHHQHIISTSSAHHQCIISESSVHHHTFGVNMFSNNFHIWKHTNVPTHSVWKLMTFDKSVSDNWRYGSCDAAWGPRMCRQSNAVNHPIALQRSQHWAI